MRPRTVLARTSAFLATAVRGAGLAASLVGGLTGCVVARHDSFTTPQDAVLTFQSAFARGDEFKEYDCFAREMKEERGLTQQVWSVARDEIFAPLGSFGRFVLRRNSLADNLVGGAREPGATTLVYELLGHGIEVVVVPEPALVLPDPVTQREEAWSLSRRAVAVERATADRVAATFVAVVEVPLALAARLEEEGVPWAELRHQWKLRSVAAHEEDAGATPPLPPLPPPRVRRIEAGAIRPVRLRASLGVVALRFELPLTTGDGGGPLDPTELLADSPFDRVRWEALRR